MSSNSLSKSSLPLEKSPSRSQSSLIVVNYFIALLDPVVSNLLTLIDRFFDDNFFFIVDS